MSVFVETLLQIAYFDPDLCGKSSFFKCQKLSKILEKVKSSHLKVKSWLWPFFFLDRKSKLDVDFFFWAQSQSYDLTFGWLDLTFTKILDIFGNSETFKDKKVKSSHQKVKSSHQKVKSWLWLDLILRVAAQVCFDHWYLQKYVY